MQCKWACDVEVVTCSFVRTLATYSPTDGLLVNFKTMESSEDISIAAKWEGENDSGYIGEGFTKRGIYVCVFFIYLICYPLILYCFKAQFMGKEYVLTQPVDLHMTESAVKSVLRTEYALLCIGDTLKKEFDRYATECSQSNLKGRQIPGA